MNKTTIAMVLGDPAGIGPELIARLLAEPQVRSQAQVIRDVDRDHAAARVQEHTARPTMIGAELDERFAARERMRGQKLLDLLVRALFFLIHNGHGFV